MNSIAYTNASHDDLNIREMLPRGFNLKQHKPTLNIHNVKNSRKPKMKSNKPSDLPQHHMNIFGNNIYIAILHDFKITSRLLLVIEHGTERQKNIFNFNSKICLLITDLNMLPHIHKMLYSKIYKQQITHDFDLSKISNQTSETSIYL